MVSAGHEYITGSREMENSIHKSGALTEILNIPNTTAMVATNLKMIRKSGRFSLPSALGPGGK
ncbi:hypothetical protein [Desulfotruncus alcoholivorax]|uniref:hypothetical protein n=1 Tax=Desulfotruncus alcoholivorax TaxID=265477 RepID=UPI00047F539C|nr:hypothetical protein [Desulfotruncus alcoholivorax]